MKLLFCPSCYDVIVLHLSGPDRDRDACQCGKTTGFYCSRERAVHNGHGVPLMIDNQDLLREVDNYLLDPNRQIERPIKAAIIPKQCQTLVVKEHPPQIAMSDTPETDAKDYDAGLLSEHGGGDVTWWQDYLRSEIGRANDHWRSQFDHVTQQRDNLADDLRDAQEALRWYHKVMPDFETKLPNWTRPTIREALAAVKGGSHE